MLERALDNDVKVRGVFKNGYITELLPLDEEDIEPFLGDIVDDEDDLDDVTKIEVKEEPKKEEPKKQEPKVLTKTKKISKNKNKPVKIVDEEDEL